MGNFRHRKVQDWENSVEFSKLGIEFAISLLESKQNAKGWYETLFVRNVEDDAEFRRLGIDLLWCVSAATCAVSLAVEVKADRNHHTGNFFFETVSDIERRTPGAFVGSRAEWYFYTFPAIAEIYCLPLYETKEWFNSCRGEFTERMASTQREGREWNTLGQLVPILRVLREVPGVRHYVYRNNVWHLAAKSQGCRNVKTVFDRCDAEILAEAGESGVDKPRRHLQ